MHIFDKMVVTDIVEVVSLRSPKGRFAKMTDRKSYGISFCTDGQITYTLEGREYVSGPGSAIILPKGKSYTLQCDETGTFFVINFECAEFLCDTFLLLPIENVDVLVRDFSQMKKLSFFERNRAKMMSLFYNLIHNVAMASAAGNNILLPAIKYLENNYCQPEITNKVLADQCEISEVYFRKLFTNFYGMTPRQYIIDIRISKARQLLTEGALKINTISEKCGFSNPYHFSRLFKEKTGLTPTEYMRQNRISKI